MAFVKEKGETHTHIHTQRKKNMFSFKMIVNSVCPLSMRFIYENMVVVYENQPK